MKIISTEEIKTIQVTTLVRVNKNLGNVVVKDWFELNSDGTKGKFIDSEMLWENNGLHLSDDMDDFGTAEKIDKLLGRQA
jgi:hypothetical protein